MNAPVIALVAIILGMVLWLVLYRATRRGRANGATGIDAPSGATIAQSPSERLADENVQFTVYRPNEIGPERWYTLLAFVHLADRPPDAAPDQLDPPEVVRQQASAILGSSIDNYQPLAQDAAQPIPHDGELTFVPEVEGLEFDPPHRTFKWREPVHRESFLLRAKTSVAGRLLRGRLAVFLGRILLADVPLSIRVSATVTAPGRGRGTPSRATFAMQSAPRYRRIFASYSYKDSAIVEEFERYARVLGDEYLRDVATLRSGEFWTERLKVLIEGADVFQLFWSWRSIDSPYVRQEWEHALQLGRPGFVRPVYWEEPLPQRPENDLPPAALSQLHFQKLPPGLIPNSRGPLPTNLERVESTRHLAVAPQAKLTLEMVGVHASSMGPNVRRILGDTEFKIGRGSDNDWILPQSYVSRHQAVIRRVNGIYFLEQVGTCPIMLNNTDRPLEHIARLSVGDRIMIDDIEIHVLEGEALRGTVAWAATLVDSPFSHGVPADLLAGRTSGPKQAASRIPDFGSIQDNAMLPWAGASRARPTAPPLPGERFEEPAAKSRPQTTKFIARNRAPRIKIDYEVGMYGPTKKVELPFTIGVLADLSGTAGGPVVPITERRFIDIDVDNFEDRLKQIRPRVCFLLADPDSAGGQITVDIALEKMADFSPSGIASKVLPLQLMLEAREFLHNLLKKIDDNDPCEGGALAIVQDPAALHRWAAQPDLTQLQTQPNLQARRIVQRALDEANVRGLGPQHALMAAIKLLDARLSIRLRQILHHPDFQAIEGAWRGLHYLVSNTETDETLKIRFLNINKEELAGVFSRFKGAAWEQSTLFKLVYETEFGQLGGEPFSCLVGDFYFGHSPADVELLASIGTLAAAAHAPFIAGASPALLGMASWQELINPRDLIKLLTKPEYAAWRALRESDDARYIGLTIPRFLARPPYRITTDPVEHFTFEELSVSADRSHFTWANSAYALAVKIAMSFKLYGCGSMLRGIESGGAVEGLPVHAFPSDTGGTDMNCPTEIAINDRRELELAFCGLIPLMHRKNTDLTGFIAMPTLQNPTVYDDPDATANARASAQLPYLLAGCRFVHYLQCIVRDRIGAFHDHESMQRWLNQWITGFVDSDPANSSIVGKAQKPLSFAKVTVESTSRTGAYSTKLLVRTGYPQPAGPLLCFAFGLPVVDHGRPQLSGARPRTLTPPAAAEQIQSLAGFPPAADILPVAEGVIDVLEIATPGGAARIELHHGDLTRMRSGDAVDVLVLSSYPNDYYPVEGSLIAALDRKGISVAALAENKHVDLRAAFSCWLSEEIRPQDPGIRFARILCFESFYRGADAPQAVGDIFRALAPFVAGEFSVSTIAMPVLAAGSQGYTAADILPPLLDSAFEWLKAGLPIRKIAIYAHGAAQAREAQKLFLQARQRFAQDARPPRKSEPRYDAFVSYAREDSSAALAIAGHLKDKKLRVFIDQLELIHGAAWQQHMFEALDSSRRVVAIYSPDYVSSKVCQEEFNIAWARGRKISANVLFPVYWRSGELPTYMDMLNFLDCREQARPKLDEACQALVASLKTQ